MKNIVKIVLLFVCFCCHTAFIVQQKVAIESITPLPPQFYKPEKVNWFQKMVIKKNAQQLKQTQEEGYQKAKKKGNISFALAIATLVFFGIALWLNVSFLGIMSIITGIAGLFTGIFTFTDIYARRSVRAKGIFAIITGVGAIVLLVFLAFALAFFD
jgi:hypothetical protein